MSTKVKVDIVPKVDYEKKYKYAKRVIHNLEKTLTDKDAKLERSTRSLDALRSAIEFVQSGKSSLSKEDIINQMQTELQSSDDEEEVEVTKREDSYDDAKN
jgi:hypothetical protein